MIIRWWYLVFAIVIIFIEVAIAIGAIPGQFMRNSVGDILAIGLVYFVLRGVTTLTPITTVIVSIAIGFTIEALQYIHLVDLLGLKQGSLFAIIIGNAFSYMDLLMYAIGGILAVGIDAAMLYFKCNRTEHSQAKG